MRHPVLVTVFDRLIFAAVVLDLPQARVWEAAQRALRSLDADLAEARATGALAALRGIGPKTLGVIDDVLAGRTPATLAAWEGRLPEGLVALGGIPGLGPKRVRALWKGLGIRNARELEVACRQRRVRTLAGFGPKLELDLLAHLTAAATTRWRRDVALRVALAQADGLRAAGAHRVEVGGELRRGHAVVEEVVLVVEGAARAPAPSEPGPPIRVVQAEGPRFAWAWIHHSVGAGHLAALRLRAAERRLDLDGGGHAFETEASIYHALHWHPVPAERRDGADDLVDLDRPRPAPLLTRADLRGAIHNHTTDSDGVGSLMAMQAAAGRHHLAWLGITDHSRTAAYARGLSIEALLAQRARIAATADHPALLAGVESDILADGALDYPVEVLASLDVVVASVHERHRQGHESGNHHRKRKIVRGTVGETMGIHQADPYEYQGADRRPLPHHRDEAEDDAEYDYVTHASGSF